MTNPAISLSSQVAGLAGVRMHSFFWSLARLLARSARGAAGGLMGTTVLALGVGAIQHYIAPLIDKYILRKPRVEPKWTGSIIFIVATWVLLFGISLVSTIYADHLGLVSQNKFLATQKLSTDSENARLRNEYAQLKDKLDSLTEPERPDSLRRRTMRIADEMQKYFLMRFQGHPPFAYPDSRDPNPSEERKKEIQRCQSYDRDTEDYYRKHFKERMIGIIREYNSKGIRTGYLEADVNQRPPALFLPGSVGEESYADDLYQFRELVYHLDAQDNLIVVAP